MPELRRPHASRDEQRALAPLDPAQPCCSSQPAEQSLLAEESQPSERPRAFGASRSRVPAEWTQPPRWLSAGGALLALFLITGIFKFALSNDYTSHSRRSVYSRVSEEQGEVWTLNWHELRRKRHTAQEDGLRGLAEQCDQNCTLALHRQHDILKVSFTRKVFNSISTHNYTEKIIPLVHFVDVEQTVAKPLSATPDCIYEARVQAVAEAGVVNLCEASGGLLGTLALTDGVYIIEPLESNTRSKRDLNVKPHLIYRSRTKHFDEPLVATERNHTDHPDHGTRSKRAANSWDYYVEVLAVADYKMLAYHGENLEAYMLTLFSTVASIYRHASLRASVNIIVVKVIVLKHENVGPRISHHAQETLQQFCAWQQNFNDRNDDALAHHDVAILVTRHDICRAINKCDTLGLAELGTMCDARKSCAIIEDNGLSAAFTIAHELGHILNIPHDDERRCARYMPLTKNNYHIMAPTLEYNTNPWAWSPCSAAMLEKFLDNQRSQTQCILDQPVERRYAESMFKHPPAGMIYSVNQQCQFVFGPSAEICPYMPTCRRLWCSTYYGFQMGCRTQHMPWADGTPCGDSMWCHRGQCVGIQPDRRLKVDGQWGEWQGFGSCTRTCGGGVQKGSRECDRPRPMNGGKYCVGQRERYRSCNIHECPFETAGFRELQCSEFDDKDVGIHGVPRNTKWVPKYAAIAENERCKLYCRAKDSAAFYLLKDKVVDGTPCSRESDDICIDGVCHRAGCDHRLGSDMQRDICGVCGGDGSTCQTVQGAYNERGSFGYNEVLRIPAGSANIDISQKAFNNLKEDDNYLALRTSSGEFLLNGQYQVSVFRQQIPIMDTVLEYSGSDNVVERINGTGPIRSDIYVHVLSVGSLNPPMVKYKFMVPRNPSLINNVPKPAKYYWTPSDAWSQCSSRCQGSQVQGLQCIDSISSRPVDDKYCASKKLAQKQRMCNVHCFFKWSTAPLTSCSARCGRGEQRQRVHCITASSSNGSVQAEQPAHDQECVLAGLPKPPLSVPCYIDCEGHKWLYSAWSQCSASCGNSGYNRRQAQCVDRGNKPVDPRYCGQIPKDRMERECNRLPCPKWTYGAWNECSRSCGGGIRVRHAACEDYAGRELSANYCSKSELRDREKCNEGLCTKWSFGTWSPCTVSCGTGIQTRGANCMDGAGRAVDEKLCDASEKITKKQCRQDGCPQWDLGAWSACSVSCLDGFRSRRVRCVDGNANQVQEEHCLRAQPDRPPTHEPCYLGPCPFWRLAPWSACSATCGQGSRIREVECVFKEQTVDASLCTDTPLAPLKHNCSMAPCASWKTSPWSPCSVTCGTGTQKRETWCQQGEHIVNNGSCTSNKPRTERSCEREECEASRTNSASRESPIYWATGPWTECSRRCGPGTQRRQVKCHDHYRELPDTYCRHLEKEASTRECNLRPCVEWRTDSWSPCTATCGVNVVRKRKVFCASADGRHATITDADCDPTDQPASIMSCNLSPCPAEPQVSFGAWKTGEWSSCSISCGIGYKRRTVYCDSKQCNEVGKPDQFKHCNEGTCDKQHTWQASPWSTCSLRCGPGGFESRRVWCQNGLKPTADNKCDPKEKPQFRRPCQNQTPCPAISTTTHRPSTKYTWSPAQWSTCSATCGPGVRVRDVFCVDALTGTQKLAHSLCDSNQKPVTESRCRDRACPKWTKGKWSECSVTCGTGFRTRDVECGTKEESQPDDACDLAEKPADKRPCEVQRCLSYQWKVTAWSKCADLCKPGKQQRRVYCMSSANKRAAPRMCDDKNTPLTKRDCPTNKCPYYWAPGPWSTCTTTCGAGRQFRKLECKVKQTAGSLANVSSEEPTVQSRMCLSLPKPSVTQNCTASSCDAKYHWSVGPWEACSKTCGQGTRRRKVFCRNREKEQVDRTLCDLDSKPNRKEDCNLRNCMPADCAELKAHGDGTEVDGEYTVLVTGFPIKVYCHMMNDSLPKTYVTVNRTDNYAEFYGKRLAYPYSCPHEGNRNDSCDCTDDGHQNAGRTEFIKVRVDLHNMKINLSYGTAGDCYSMNDCPQGRFSIDLRGSGLRVVADLQWTDHGHRTSSHIERSQNNAVIKGACGGYCGECAPDRFKGLVVEVDHNPRKRREQ